MYFQLRNKKSDMYCKLSKNDTLLKQQLKVVKQYYEMRDFLGFQYTLSPTSAA